MNECDEQAKPHGISGKWFAPHGNFAPKWQKWQKMVEMAIKNSHFYFSLLYIAFTSKLNFLHEEITLEACDLMTWRKDNQVSKKEDQRPMLWVS